MGMWLQACRGWQETVTADGHVGCDSMIWQNAERGRGGRVQGPRALPRHALPHLQVLIFVPV